MKKFVYFLLLVQLVACGSSGDPKSDNKTPVDLKTKLEQLEKRFLDLKGYSCTIELMTSQAEQGGYPPQTGKFYGKKGKYQVDFEEDRIISDTKDLMTWSKEFGNVKMVPYSEAKASDMSLAGIYQLHAGNWTYYEGKSTDEYDLVTFNAKQKTGAFGIVDVYIGKKTQLIDKYHLYSDAYGAYKYNLTDVKIDVDLPDSLFFIDLDWINKIESGEIKPEESHHGHDHHEGDGHQH